MSLYKLMPSSAIRVRRAKPQDAQVCGQICFDAFHRINGEHGFPPDLPSADIGVRLLFNLFSHPKFYCVVAESDGELIGSNCLDERSPIGGIGPITIHPGQQNRRVGRALMDAVLKRASERHAPGVRLVQAAFHNRSLSLYTKLGFDVREPISVMNGSPLRKRIDGFTVRPAQVADLEACNRVCQKVHGHDRGGELAEAIEHHAAKVVERQGVITGYSSSMAFFGHAVAETNLDLKALISEAEAFEGPGILVPSRNAPLFRWCLENGLKVVEPLTLMTLGLYNEPAGAYLCSISH